MKFALSLALAAAFAFSGCSVFRRSPTWDSIVSSRSQFFRAESTGTKDGYIEHVHQLLTSAGVEHKVVTYQFHYLNVYHEEAVETAVAVVYRDDTTPKYPWWVTDHYRAVPVWLPNWDLDRQLEFFIQRRVDVLSVKEYPGTAAAPRSAKLDRRALDRLARTSGEKKFRTAFATGGTPKTQAPRSAKAPAPRRGSDPAETKGLPKPAPAGQSSDSQAAALFRSTHGTEFDPGSSVDRAKMTELRRQWLNRQPRLGLRTR